VTGERSHLLLTGMLSLGAFSTSLLSYSVSPGVKSGDIATGGIDLGVDRCLAAILTLFLLRGVLC
jgi:hypothetical protein